MTQDCPRYHINMALAPLHWTPEIWQITKFVNPSVLNSLWLGTVWNLFLLPTRFWHECLVILAAGHMRLAFAQFGVILWSFWKVFTWGLNGNARAVNLPLDTIVQSTFLNAQEAFDAIKVSRRYDLLTEVRNDRQA